MKKEPDNVVDICPERVLTYICVGTSGLDSQGHFRALSFCPVVFLKRHICRKTVEDVIYFWVSKTNVSYLFTNIK